MQLEREEGIVTQVRSARLENPREVPGELVLTTARLVFVEGGAITYAVRRADIGHANQHFGSIYVFERGKMPGIGFAIRSPFVGPVRWEWYLNAAPTTHSLRGRMWGTAGDPRIGMIDPARRAVLERWRDLMGSFTISPTDHILDDLPDVPVDWADIVEIVYIADGKGDGPSWMLVVRLGDGRWVYFEHVLQITGEVYTTSVVARTLETLWWGAFTEEERDRLTAQMTQERVEEEKVFLDALLESPDANLRGHAEHRMAQLEYTRPR